MSKYVDGFLLVVPKKNIENYRRLSLKAGKIWRDHGALEYRESAGDDLQTKHGLPFPKLLKLKKGQVIVFSWIVFKSRKHRDTVNANVMKDDRMKSMMNDMPMPFDMKRMSYGGFKTFVDIA